VAIIIVIILGTIHGIIHHTHGDGMIHGIMAVGAGVGADLGTIGDGTGLGMAAVGMLAGMAAAGMADTITIVLITHTQEDHVTDMAPVDAIQHLADVMVVHQEDILHHTVEVEVRQLALAHHTEQEVEAHL
jgi:glyoxylase-like metal-dependent hydrolase (beta-lactamase superfamily II)